MVMDWWIVAINGILAVLAYVVGVFVVNGAFLAILILAGIMLVGWKYICRFGWWLVSNLHHIVTIPIYVGVGFLVFWVVKNLSGGGG